MVSYLKSRYIRMTQGTPTSQTEPKLKGVQGFFCVDTFGLQKVWCLPQCLDSPFDRPAPRFNGAAFVAISCPIKKGNDTTTKYYSSKILLELIYSIYTLHYHYTKKNLRICSSKYTSSYCHGKYTCMLVQLLL